MKAKGITTVGDLAQLTEVDINNMPFKAPKVDNVRTALGKFFSSWIKKQQD